jgi:uncharacterized damage-inducible protein DinB
MSLAIPLVDLLDYSDHERRKWRAWLAADPSRLQLPLQGSGRFPTVGALLDHLFLIERRHLARLEGSTPPDATGVPPGDLDDLFEYADLVRADFRTFVEELDEERADEMVHVFAPSGQFSLTRRRLAVHVLLHEIRHLAQLALAARLAGAEPPGQHDFAFFRGKEP